jgi:hypothetical protein
MPILDATPEKKEPAYDTRYTDRSENDFSSGRFDERDADKIINEDSERNTKNIGERKDINPRDTDNGYRRHDYMDLFSTSNPNLFGRGEEEFDRNSDRETDRDKTFDIGFETEDRGTGVDDRSRYEGMYIFDDESELDRNSDRSSDRGEVNLFEGIKMDEDDGDSRGGFKQEGSRDALFEDNFNNFSKW